MEAARRDSEAFAALYRRYLNPLYRYLLRRSNGVHDAEDLTAQVFTEALEGLVDGRYREGGCFAAWLFTIARRRLVDFYRMRPVEPLGDPPSPEPGLLVAVEKGEDLQRLARRGSPGTAAVALLGRTEFRRNQPARRAQRSGSQDGPISYPRYPARALGG